MAMSPHPNPLPRERARVRGSGSGPLERPQPGRAAYPAGVAVHRFADRRFTLAAEDPLLHQVRHRLIQPFDVAHPAAQHDNVRVEDIHHVGQRFRQPLFIAAQRQFSLFVTFSTRRIISLPVNPLPLSR